MEVRRWKLEVRIPELEIILSLKHSLIHALEVGSTKYVVGSVKFHKIHSFTHLIIHSFKVGKSEACSMELEEVCYTIIGKLLDC